ncbi:MAG: class I SAM-dependent methyltransferase [Planctomycetaceae bacterium]|jgi:SAM-dependent methyltransferase|nr:class I SAM-dependent methyltransferase [Planctomycetaceae bacterium]
MSQTNCYDYPQYWDLAFADETGQECEFLVQCSQKHLSGDAKRILEPGCGGGRLVVALASRGYDVTGYDLSNAAIDYLQQRLDNEGLQARAVVADMQSFVASPPVDIAINTVSTFRHLLTEQAALAHLRVMAESIRPKGLYIIGMHLLPPDADLEDEELWEAEDDAAKVTMRLTVLEASRENRQEVLRFDMSVVDIEAEEDDSREFSSEYPMRLYSATQIQELFSQVSEFELIEVYDYWYDINEPQPLDDRLGDAVFVLRRR